MWKNKSQVKHTLIIVALDLSKNDKFFPYVVWMTLHVAATSVSPLLRRYSVARAYKSW